MGGLELQQQWWEAPSHRSHHIWEPSRLLAPLSHWGLQDSISWVRRDLRASPPFSARFPQLVEVTVTLALLAATPHCWLIKTSYRLKTRHLSLLLLTQVSHILCVFDGDSEPQCKQRSLLPFSLIGIYFGPMLISALLGPFQVLPLTFPVLSTSPTFPHAPPSEGSSAPWVNQCPSLWSQTYRGPKS